MFAGLPLAGVLIAVLGGGFGGVVTYTIVEAKGLSYLSDDPAACVNCHIMNDQYSSWMKASHHARATCNDCHVPHDSVVHKYLVKAEHGYRHSKGFTLQNFHEPIQITESSYALVNQNCVRCHESLTHDIRTAGGVALESKFGSQVDCIHCHASVAHGTPR